jgi:hypothetical protein
MMFEPLYMNQKYNILPMFPICYPLINISPVFLLRKGVRPVPGTGTAAKSGFYPSGIAFGTSSQGIRILEDICELGVPRLDFDCLMMRQ